MAESLAPIDESVALPPAVRAAAERANAHYQQQAPATPPEPEQTPEPPAAEAAPAQTPEPPAPAPTPEPEAQADIVKLQRDYKALLGRNAQQREYIAMQQQQLAQLSNPRSWAAPENPKRSLPLITDEERKAYGDDALSVMERKAREVVQPIVNDLNQKNQQLARELQQVKANDVYAALDDVIPNWREVNQSDDWKGWLHLPDLYSGIVRQNLLNQAFAAGDAGRILAFFRGFLDEYPEHMGQQAPAPSAASPAHQQPMRKAAIKLESLAAPGRASPSPQAATNDAPTITNKDVSRFYADVTHGRYAGRDAEKSAREAQIHAAVRDGRVQIVK